MMNDDTPKVGKWNYDPTDQTSFPYQSQDPPFSAADLVPDPVSIEAVTNGTLDFNTLLEAMQTDWMQRDGNAYAIWDMALRLFAAMINDEQHAYADIAYPDLMTVALDTSILWAVG